MSVKKRKTTLLGGYLLSKGSLQKGPESFMHFMKRRGEAKTPEIKFGNLISKMY